MSGGVGKVSILTLEGRDVSQSGEIDGRTAPHPSPVVPGKDLPGVNPDPQAFCCMPRRRGGGLGDLR